MSRTYINSWGANYGGNPGGVRVAEAVYYTNFLSHAECKNVVRYLQEKWGCLDGGVRAQGVVLMNVTVPDGMTVLAETAYPVARIGSLGFELSQVSLSFSRPLRFARSSLRYDGGVLYVFFTPKGMTLSFR